MIKADITIHEAPSAESPVLNRANQGEILRMSTRPSRGWYKVHLPQPVGSIRYGYVSIGDIEPDTADNDLRIAGIAPYDPIERESEQRPWLLRAYYEFLVLNPDTLLSAVGSSTPVALGHAFGGEFGRMFDNGIFFGLRGGYSLASASGAGNFNASTIFTGLAFDYEFFYHYPFAIDVGFTAGAAYLGQITGLNTAGAALDGSFLVAPEGTARLWAVYYMGGVFGVSLGVGFRALYAPVATLSGSSTNLWLGGGFGHASMILRF